LYQNIKAAGSEPDAIAKCNVEKIKYFIKEILNPIIKAVCDYEREVQKAKDNEDNCEKFISWVSLGLKNDLSQEKSSSNEELLREAIKTFNLNNSEELS
jgi:hypothetical protein